MLYRWCNNKNRIITEWMYVNCILSNGVAVCSFDCTVVSFRNNNKFWSILVSRPRITKIIIIFFPPCEYSERVSISQSCFEFNFISCQSKRQNSLGWWQKFGKNHSMTMAMDSHEGYTSIAYSFACFCWLYFSLKF